MLVLGLRSMQQNTHKFSLLCGMCHDMQIATVFKDKTDNEHAVVYLRARQLPHFDVELGHQILRVAI